MAISIETSSYYLNTNIFRFLIFLLASYGTLLTAITFSSSFYTSSAYDRVSLRTDFIQHWHIAYGRPRAGLWCRQHSFCSLERAARAMRNSLHTGRRFALIISPWIQFTVYLGEEYDSHWHLDRQNLLWESAVSLRNDWCRGGPSDTSKSLYRTALCLGQP